MITTAQAMAIAIHEGKKGAGYVAPNPLVGCVILDKNRNLLATGYHHKVGHAHAEIDALNKIEDLKRIEGGHIYVTLEPCAHQGRTGSCAKALAPLKPATVTYAVEDPNPLVAGQGAQILRDAGVDVELLIYRKDLTDQEARDLTEQAEELAEIFLLNFRRKEPFIALKFASSLDGKIAYASGESKWITGEKAREHVHFVRAHYDAVAIGRRTFETDNPSLNIRHPGFPNLQNKAVVFDPEGKTLSKIVSSNLAQVRPLDQIFIVVDSRRRDGAVASIEAAPSANVDSNASGPASVDAGPTLIRVDMSDNKAILASLRQAGLTSILIEGGATTYAKFFPSARRLHAYIAPVVMGGQSTLGWSDLINTHEMKSRIDLHRVERHSLGADEYWTARL